MNQKQNNKFVLGRLYPQYFKPPIQSQQHPEQSKITTISKSKQQKKIQSKLKTIIYNLQRDLQQKNIMKRQRNNSQYGNQYKGSIRSFSQKSIGRSQRHKTQLQSQLQTSDTERTQLYAKSRKKLQNSRQTQALILPKLKLNNRINEQAHRKQLLARKKYHKLSSLDEQQQQLGKIVLQKVQKHFEMQKMGKKLYFERVKSEQGIDQSFINYLRNKVKKANIVLQT